MHQNRQSFSKRLTFSVPMKYHSLVSRDIFHLYKTKHVCFLLYIKLAKIVGHITLCILIKFTRIKLILLHAITSHLQIQVSCTDLHDIPQISVDDAKKKKNLTITKRIFHTHLKTYRL